MISYERIANSELIRIQAEMPDANPAILNHFFPGRTVTADCLDVLPVEWCNFLTYSIRFYETQNLERMSFFFARELEVFTTFMRMETAGELAA